jgi:predicted KAP-like P-loop ATPase
MNFFINPLIEMDSENPYKNDYTNKFKNISVGLKSLISIECKDQPLVMSIDAPWGTGKTTFIDMFGQDLIIEKKVAIKFDAWKNDHSDYPLLAFISEINDQLENLKTKGIIPVSNLLN